MDNSASLVNAVLRLTLTTMIYVVYLVLLKICCVINCVLNLLISNSSNIMHSLGGYYGTVRCQHITPHHGFPVCVSSQLMPEYVFCQNVTLYCRTKTDAFL